MQFDLIDTRDGFEIHRHGCAHTKRTEGTAKALRNHVVIEADNAAAVIDGEIEKLRQDFGDDAENFFFDVKPCAR